MADEPKMPGTFARTMTVILERIAAGESEAEVLADYTWEHGAPPDLTPFRDCRAQLEAVTRERDDLLNILNGPEVVGLCAQVAALRHRFAMEHMPCDLSTCEDCEAIDRSASAAAAFVASVEAPLRASLDNAMRELAKAQIECERQRAQLEEARSQFKALQEHMGKSGPWPKQIEVDGAYWRPQAEELRAELAEAMARKNIEIGSLRAQLEEVTKERDEARAPREMFGAVWVRGIERDRLAARVAKLEAAGMALATCLRGGYYTISDEPLLLAAWDAAVKPEQS